MTSNHERRLRKLRAIDLADWATTFWLIKRKTTQREASYSAVRVEIDVKLQKRFKGYLKQQLQTRDFHLEAYEDTNADTDDVLLTVDAGTTDFRKIEAAIVQGFDNPRAEEYEELLN